MLVELLLQNVYIFCIILLWQTFFYNFVLNFCQLPVFFNIVAFSFQRNLTEYYNAMDTENMTTIFAR